MKLLFLIPSLDPAHGGPPEAVRTLGAALARLGHTITVATLDAPDAPWLAAPGCAVEAHGPAYTAWRYAPGFTRWLARRAADYDAVIVNGLWQFQTYAAWRALHGGRTPYLLYPHGMLDPWFRVRHPLKHLKKWLFWPWADYRALRDARAVLYTSDEERRLARRSFGLYRAREVVAGLGTADPPAAAARQAEAFLARFPALRGRRVLLYLSRLHPKKGCDLLIEAFAHAAAGVADARLVLAGPDPAGLRPELERLAARLGVAARITWTGMLTGDEKWGAFRVAEAFALPSHTENFGIVVAEALACGTPVLVSDKVNVWREVVDGGAGHAAPDDAPGTRALLARWYALDAPGRDALAAAARPVFLRCFEIDGVARRLAAIVGERCAEPGEAPPQPAACAP